MRSRDRAGLALAPVFLRVALAVTFIWAGLGKFMSRFDVPPEEAAILANYGVIPNPGGTTTLPSPPAENPEQPAETPDEPGDGAGEPISRGAPRATIRLASWQGAAQPGPRLATGADFDGPVSVSGRAMLVLMLHSAIHPGLRPEDSTPLMPLWPDLDPQTDYDQWPVRLAWAVSLTELIGGILVGIGLLTRLGALGLAGVMLGALWLATVGPAMQSGNAVFGFLPNHATFSPDWTTPLLQLILFCAAMALLFVGPGTLSLDRLFLGGPPRPAPKPAPAPPAPAAKK